MGTEFYNDAAFVDPIDLDRDVLRKFGIIENVTVHDICPRKGVTVRSRYFMEIVGKGQYCIYKYNHHSRTMSYIYRYNNPQDAVDALNRLNGNIDTNHMKLQTYELICEYSKNKITAHEFIIGLLTVFSYGDDYNFHHLLRVCENYRKSAPNVELVNWDTFRIYVDINPIAEIYDNLYDLSVIEYGGFKAAIYEEIDHDKCEQFIIETFEIFDINWD